ncbi:Tetraspanin family [Popillia japonica]|uniref:Tetraspanin family n=1 Tax=Popillia japonica TaxID=7064 RepID=A0AAW1IUK4_POPJA
MKLQVNETAVKVALVAFNFVFSILSVALIALGVVYVDDLVLPKKYIGLDFFELPTLLIVLGSLSFVASLAGCYCARTDSQRLTKFFIIFLSVLLALQLTISLISFLNMGNATSSKIGAIMRNQLQSEDEVEKESFHNIESHYACCGIDSPNDYVDADFETGKCCSNKVGVCTTEHIQNSTSLSQKPGCAITVANVIRRIALEIGCYSTNYLLINVY